MLVHQLGRALLLQGLWKLRWFHVVALWLLLGYHGWNASPYVMVYIFKPPLPGTAPRYTGPIRYEGQYRRGSNGSLPPAYFVRTNTGDVQVHCGFLPAPWECWFTNMLGVAPEPDEVYEIGFHWYWGIDYVKHPLRYAHQDDGSEHGFVQNRRVSYLRKHRRAAAGFAALLSAYLLLIAIAFRGIERRKPAGPFPSPVCPRSR
jgi:hypothetical protein